MGGDGSGGFATWAAKRDELRRRLAAKPARLGGAGPLSLAPGAYVDPDGLVARIWARNAFLRLAGDIQPRLLAGLAAAPLDEFAAAWDAAGGPPEADPEPNPASAPWTVELFRIFMEGPLAERGPTWAWLRRWGLPIGAPSPPLTAGDDAFLRHAAAAEWGVAVAGGTLLIWRSRPLPAPEHLRLVDPFAVAPWSPDRDLGLGGALALPVPRWDPQGETLSAAQARIEGELRVAVRAELGRIAAAARARAVPSPAKRTGTEHLAWLARYHLRGESYAAIARAVGRERQTVADGVKGAAALVGLPLRPPNPPGRPRAAPPPARIVRLASPRT